MCVYYSDGCALGPYPTNLPRAHHHHCNSDIQTGEALSAHCSSWTASPGAAQTMPGGQCLLRGRQTYKVRCHKADSLPNLHRKVYRTAKPPGGLQPSCLTPHCTLEVLQRPYPNPMSRLCSREGKGGKTNYSTRQCHPVGDNACAEACTPAVPAQTMPQIDNAWTRC